MARLLYATWVRIPTKTRRRFRRLTTDAGLLLVREFDEQLGLRAEVAGRITDTRGRRDVTHELDALVRQRLYQIATGYEDVNDVDRSATTRRFEIVAADGRTTLGWEPTLSRLENAIEAVIRVPPVQSRPRSASIHRHVRVSSRAPS